MASQVNVRLVELPTSSRQRLGHLIYRHFQQRVRHYRQQPIPLSPSFPLNIRRRISLDPIIVSGILWWIWWGEWYLFTRASNKLQQLWSGTIKGGR
ncbi:hypothetical protein PM082_009405 [Marasmius tenuissimus]|nr:hypothetical protein PM082_009405 [Marasmius tenuissimus]